MSKKILIIDDNPDVVKVVGIRLKMNGYEVITAGDGVEGFEKGKQENPDLILLDVNMPNMDGFETLTKLKEDTQTASIPIIMLTAQQQIDDLNKASNLGAVDYIVKPFNNRTLLEKIYKVLK